MKNRIIITSLIIAAALFTACEQTTTVDVEIPTNVYTVVESELVADSLFTGVRFTKTLPLEVDYDIELAELKNVTAYLKVDGTQVIPLHYDMEGIYKPLYEYVIEPGRTYELIAEYEDKLIYAKTTVPEEPDVVRATYHDEFYLTAEVKTKQHEVYGAAWVISGKISSEFHSITEAVNKTVPELVTARTIPITADLRSAAFRAGTRLIVYAFDEQFYDYFRSKDNHQFIEDGISQGGGLVTWNAFGENVIGVFIGIAESELIRPD